MMYLKLKYSKHSNISNIVKLKDSGNLLLDNQKYAYAILDFISGETLSDKMKRDQTFPKMTLKNYFRCLKWIKLLAQSGKSCNT